MFKKACPLLKREYTMKLDQTSWTLNKTPYYNGALNSLHITLFDCLTPTSKLFIICDLLVFNTVLSV